MRIYLLLTATILFFTSYGQIDTTKIYNCTHLKRGFYRNYKEFINNNPSTVTDFIVTLLVKSETDTTVVAAEYQLADSTKKVHHVWGFCDGNNVYVNYSGTGMSNCYWKLLALGPKVFFAYEIKNRRRTVGYTLLAFGTGAIYTGLLLSAASTVTAGAINYFTETPPPLFEYRLMRINKQGEFMDLGVDETCDLLSEMPALLKEYKAKNDMKWIRVVDSEKKDEPHLSNYELGLQKQQALITEYLTKLNDILKKG